MQAAAAAAQRHEVVAVPGGVRGGEQAARDGLAVTLEGGLE